MNSQQLISNLFFSFNNVIPVFIIILIGFFLRRTVFTPHFSQSSNKLVFTIALPAMIFDSLYTTDLRTTFEPKIILFSVSCTILLFCIVAVVAFFSLSEKKSLGSFVQGSFRSNFVIIGIPLIKNLADSFGEGAISRSSAIVSVIMPLYNILAILILTYSSSEKTALSFKKIVTDIFKNPLILAVLAALPFALFSISLPPFVKKVIAYLADIAIPLALIDIGANIKFPGFVRTLRPALAASVIKTVVTPLIFTVIAYYLNFRGADLGVLYILFASPTAISSFIMAKGMNNDADLAANIVLISTAGSIITIFTGVFILRSLGLLS